MGPMLLEAESCRAAPTPSLTEAEGLRPPWVHLRAGRGSGPRCAGEKVCTFPGGLPRGRGSRAAAVDFPLRWLPVPRPSGSWRPAAWPPGGPA